MYDRTDLTETPPVAVQLVTARLHLAPLGVADAAELAAVTDDPVITGRVDFLSSPFGPAQAQALIESDPGFHGIRLAADRQLIGLLGAHRRPAGDGGFEVEIGYWIGPAFQRHGYAREALTAILRALHGEIVFAECHPANIPSWSLLHAVGFEPTGRAGKREGRERLSYAPRA
jgi:RimJ/RimL family protein N-acetyltransferase